jgi:ABC-type antimicrobial peptide transport system permease subunit
MMSFSVGRRTREVGIRMALGAKGGDVVKMIFGQGALQLTAGLVIGLALALLIGQPMSVILFDVQPRDPTIFIGVALTLLVTGLLACLIPARRATRVDPLTALRAQ